MNKYYIVNISKSEFETMFNSAITTDIVGSFNNLRWNDTDTKCVVKTKLGISEVPTVLNDPRVTQYSYESILIELQNTEWL